MLGRILCPMALGCALLLPGDRLAGAGGGSSPKPQVILLKLDDITPRGSRDGAPISPRWQRVADFIEGNHLKAAFGIICDSLEGDNPAYLNWIIEHHRKGAVEFWLHGYRDRKREDKTGEFEQGTFEEQKALLERSERLAKEKLGFGLAAFGPHWSATTDATDQALDAVPEIKIWLYGPKTPKHFSRLSLERVLSLENPTFVPDFEKFKDLYEKLAAGREVLVLQGHPDQWANDKRWEGFVKIIEFLKSRGCVFMTPSEYLASVSKTAG